MKYITKILILLFLLNLNLYANTVGTITALSGSAFIQRDGKSIDATLGAKLEQKDSIKTKDATKVQIIFNDETIISIGKNSNFSIDEFLFEEGEAPSAKFGLLSGAMRTITGKIADVAPDKFSVKTKTATIGIRGTNFSIFAGEDGSARVFCTYGAISVTAQGDSSSSIVTQGFYILVSADGTRSAPIKFTPQELKEAKEESFATSSDDDSSDPDTQDNDASEPMADSPIDTNNNEDLGLVVENITDSARQAAEQEALNRGNYSLIGETSFLNYIVKVDVLGSIFNGASIIDGQNTFTTSKTANSFTSMDKFTSSIISVTSTDPDITSIGLSTPEDNYFNATGDDLMAGDSMSWGEWGISYDYTDSLGSAHSQENHLWIAGEATPTSVIDAYRGANMNRTYSGIYKAVYSDNNYIPINGLATLNVDFGNDIAVLNIGANLDSSGIEIVPHTINNLIINGNQMNGVDGLNRANGSFYGADGKSAGGTFYIRLSPGEVNGVYQVKAP
ncbi:MAG: FecR family protein [Sulfurimonas sp.]|uniref:FecR family protein n=1 Tax=Sulfurimonas sp. TaxID=2022749 RepID=UPI0025D46141|nr:FecR family protein [Sulfurimonas sp.]MCK9490890.1 FecR family protein [Sulfurimonas sp.]